MGGGGSKNTVDIKPAFEAAFKTIDDPIIISVGSGFGVTEKELDSKYNVDIITIDPLEEKFQKPEDMSLVKLPMFPDCQTFMDSIESKTDDDINDNIIMILDWPSPNEATYGIKAIELVEPKVIVIRYAACGAAGSNLLHSFLKSCDCPNSSGLYFEDTTSKMDGKYLKIYQDIVKVEDTMDIISGGISYTIVVLVKN